MLMTGAMYDSANGSDSPRRWTLQYTSEAAEEMARQLAAARAAQLDQSSRQLPKPSSSNEQAHDEQVAVQSPRTARLRHVVQGPLVGTPMAPIPEQP